MVYNVPEVLLLCLTVDHDWRFVSACGRRSASWLALSPCLFHRAQATIERTRIAWLGLACSRSGLWYLGNSLHCDARL